MTEIEMEMCDAKNYYIEINSKIFGSVISINWDSLRVWTVPNTLLSVCLRKSQRIQTVDYLEHYQTQPHTHTHLNFQQKTSCPFQLPRSNAVSPEGLCWLPNWGKYQKFVI